MNVSKAAICALGLAMLVPAAGGSASAAGAAPFEDSACPQANPFGRKLNELSASGHASNDDLVASAQGLVDAYRDCAQAFDRILNSKNSDHGSDYVPVHRAYARLQLARSLQRLAIFAQELGDSVKARSRFDAALQSLAEINTIMGDTSAGMQRDSAEGKLVVEGRALHDQIVDAEAKLSSERPTPISSASPSSKEK